MNAFSNQVSVERLISEISSIHSRQIMLSWDEEVKDKEVEENLIKISSRFNDDLSPMYSSRQILALAMAENGYSGVPGIKPSIIEMIKMNKFKVRHARTGLPLLRFSDVDSAPGEWLISTEDAKTIREELLTDRQREILKLKATEGRYTLEEAAELIYEAALFEGKEDSDDLLDELDDSVDIEYTEIINELSDAAIQNELRVCWPGIDRTFSYDERAVVEVRVYYEEVYWCDLNNWLNNHYPEISYRFPDPKWTEGKNKNYGVTKAEIVCVDWPLPSGRYIKKILDEKPKWIISALVSRGNPGGGIHGSHRWNPALIAVCLHDHWPRNATIEKLSQVIERSYEDYREQWKEILERLDSGS